MKRNVALLLFLALGSFFIDPAFAQTFNIRQIENKIDLKKPWSERIADSFMMRHSDEASHETPAAHKWTYDMGTTLEGFRQLLKKNHKEKYFDYIKQTIDHYIKHDGKIDTYKYSDSNLDNINAGRQLLTLYQVTKESKYKTAADTLRKQLEHQPRTKSNGFWHKKIYPNQMWLDGLYMGEPFYAEYSKIFNEPKNFDDIAYQFILIEKHTRDAKTGLLYHAWDESKKMKWADPETGKSPNLWSRAMGWYAMALVDVLDYFPKNHPKRIELIKILQRLSKALLEARDSKSKIWYQVTNMPNKTGNYLEASASCMFTYVFAKGANKDYLPKKYLKFAKESYDGIIKHFVAVDKNGFVDLYHTCRGAGLGGKPYRDGSFEYYISEPQRTNDMKGIGPFILAAIELENAKAL